MFKKGNFINVFKVTIIISIIILFIFVIFSCKQSKAKEIKIGAIIAVTAALIGSRIIRQARIPKFVKKAREMKKSIKGKKSISESL